MISKQLLMADKSEPAINPNNMFLVQGGSIVDQSPDPKAGTLQGTMTIVGTGGKFGNGYLDNTNGRVIYDLQNITTDFFIEVWIQLKSTFSGTWCHMVGKGNGLGQGTWVLGIQNRQLAFVIGGSTVQTQFAVRGTSTLVANQWYHLSASKVGSSFSVFVDGTKETTASSVYSMTNASGFSMGDRRAGDPFLQYPTAGLFSGVRISLNDNPPTANFTPPTAPWVP